MLKSILLVATLTVFSFSGFSWSKIIKENGGLFGYRTVTESVSGPNSILACADPGHQKCRGNGLSVIDQGGVVIPIDDFSPIEEAVTAQITRENPSGSLYYGSNYYVVYSYDADSGKLVMEIYSLYEARSLGLI